MSDTPPNPVFSDQPPNGQPHTTAARGHAQPPSDRELASRARRGDTEALGDLLERHQTRLYNIALRMTGHRDDAAELTQESMLKIVEHIAQFRGGSKITTWMIRIVMNTCLSHLRRRATRGTASLDHEPTTGTGRPAIRETLPDHREPQPGWSVQREEAARQVRIALALLDPDHRAVLILRDMQDLDYKKISDVLDIPTGTVKSRLFRARVALRHELALLEERGSHEHQARPAKPAG